MIFVKIYNPSYTPITTIYTPDIYSIVYSDKLNEAGSLDFSVYALTAKATGEAMQKGNKVELYIDNKIVWSGLMNTVKLGRDTHQINCIGLLGIFDDYFIEQKDYQLPSCVGDTVASLLSMANQQKNTFIKQGNVDGLSPYNKKVSYATILSCWKDAVKSDNANVWITPNDRKLHCKTERGTDKASDVFLRYNYNLISTANIKDSFQVIDNLNDYANRIIGVSDTRSYKLQNDSEVDQYGLHAKYISYGKVDDNTLFAKVKNELNNYVNNIRVEQLDILPDTIENSSIEVGDIVTVDILNENYQIKEPYKITEKTVKIGSTNQLEISVKVTKKASNKAVVTLVDYFNDITKRVSNLEKELL